MKPQSMLLYVDARYLSPYALSAYVALRTKDIAFDIATVDLGSGAISDAFLVQAPAGRVPTLVHGDFALSESTAIAEYLDENFPGPALYPEGAQDKARARQLQAWLRSDLLPLRQERSTEVVFHAPVDQALSEAARRSVERLLRVADSMLPEGREHLFGAWCIADVDLALMLNRLHLNGDALPAHLAAYAERQWRHPLVQEWVGKAKVVA